MSAAFHINWERSLCIAIQHKKFIATLSCSHLWLVRDIAYYIQSKQCRETNLYHQVSFYTNMVSVDSGGLDCMCSQNLCFILIYRALNCYATIGANLSKPPVTSLHMCVCITAKNLGLIQPKLGCFSCSLASLHSLVWSTSWLTLLKSPFVHLVTQVWMPDILPSKHNYATADTWIL